MDLTYPQGPASVPPDLTTPGPAYRRHAWLATIGVIAFVVAYFALAGWFSWVAWHSFGTLADGDGEHSGSRLFGGFAAAMLALFMIKALFFIQRGAANTDHEVTAQQQPQLFAFLHRLADEVGAPRPHRVFLSGRVNAAVFYDLSIANFFVPSRKNLEIGLALVNVLTLGELKAVLAHEFGHFAQRTMAVGRWVYMAQQITSQIVTRRDAFDKFLVQLSSIDFRIGWIGWALRLAVWAIRSVMELLFRVVVLAQRALSREMEFQADLVAVSVTGSEALIDALHRLGAADDAWNRTLAFASQELRAGRPVADLFAVQDHIIDRTRQILDDPAYGAVPATTRNDPGRRLFKAALAAPPQMWSTHPSNSDREDNAKRRFIAAPTDDRSAWSVFGSAQSLREQLSAKMAGVEPFNPVPIAQSLENLDIDYQRRYLDHRYRGVYLGRSIVRHVATAQELYEKTAPQDRDALLQALDRLYPPELTKSMERLRELQEEHSALQGLRAGFLTAPGGVIQHRGESISRKQLAPALQRVQSEIDEVAAELRRHDRSCRSNHLAAANACGPGWAEYLRGLLGLHHYASHVEANLLDAQALLTATVSVALADGEVSKKEMAKIIEVADALQSVLKDIDEDSAQITLDETLLQQVGETSWRAAVEEFRMPTPTTANIGDWLEAINGWVASLGGSLRRLNLLALEQLLDAETRVADALRCGATLPAAPAAATLPKTYRLLIPGTERPQDLQLSWWDRFQTASGTLPTLARLLAAAAIVEIVIWISMSL